MYHPNFEFIVELHRKEILNGAKLGRPEEAVLAATPYRPGWFAHSMYDLANWMIATGKQLRRRYEVPSTSRNQPARGSFAH
jgi:hypothetical protein